MKNAHLIAFLNERPSINVESLMRELGIDKRNFYAIINNKRKIPQHKRGVFYRTLKKYGQKFDFDIELQPICYNPV